MSKLFKNYEECVKIIIIMSRELNKSSLDKIKNAINVCDSLIDDADKIFRLTYSFKECLWDIDEAVIIGFNQYLIKEAKRIGEAIAYHDMNCQTPTNCNVCNTIKTQVNLLCGEY